MVDKNLINQLWQKLVKTEMDKDFFQESFIFLERNPVANATEYKSKFINRFGWKKKEYYIHLANHRPCEIPPTLANSPSFSENESNILSEKELEEKQNDLINQIKESVKSEKHIRHKFLSLNNP